MSTSNSLELATLIPLTPVHYRIFVNSLCYFHTTGRFCYLFSSCRKICRPPRIFPPTAWVTSRPMFTSFNHQHDLPHSIPKMRYTASNKNMSSYPTKHNHMSIPNASINGFFYIMSSLNSMVGVRYLILPSFLASFNLIFYLLTDYHLPPITFQPFL